MQEKNYMKVEVKSDEAKLDQHLDEVEAHPSALGHQVVKAATSLAFSVDRGAS